MAHTVYNQPTQPIVRFALHVCLGYTPEGGRVAVTKDWTAAGTDQVTGPSCTRYFAGGSSTDWCVHTVQPAYVSITVRNRDSEALYVAINPALSGTAAATNNATRLQQNEAQTFVLAGVGSSSQRGRFSTWATDGATHAMDITFERHP